MKGDLRVLHIMSGDLWAGAEVQSYTLITQLCRTPATVVGAVVLNQGTLSAKLQALGIDVEILDETQMDARRIVCRLRRLIQVWQPDVIHTHRDKENILGAIANVLTRRVPSVRTVHGGEEHRGAGGWRAVRRRAVVGADRWVQWMSGQAIVAVSSDLAATLAKRSPKGRILVIENGVDVESLRARVGLPRRSSAWPDETRIGIVGRLVPIKRVDLFLGMARCLLDAEPTRVWKFEVFGDGPERGQLEALGDRLGIGRYVTFHGHLDDVAKSMSGLDVLVMCSDHEGLPMAALEAAALGVPTVAHAVGGLIDVVPAELQVTRHEPRGYCEAVQRALRSDLRDIAEKHAKRVIERFSAERNAERVIALYRAMVSPEATSGVNG